MGSPVGLGGIDFRIASALEEKDLSSLDDDAHLSIYVACLSLPVAPVSPVAPVNPAVQ